MPMRFLYQHQRRLVTLAAAAAALLSASAGSALAQPTAPNDPSVQLGIGILGAIPKGDFAKNVESEVGGLMMSAGYRLPRSRVWIGGELGYLEYGQETRKVPLSPTVPDITVTLDTDNQILLFNSRVRYEVGPGRFQPYVEGVAGLQRLWTATSIANQASSSGDLGLSTTHLSDTVAAYGGGAGVAIGFGATPSRSKLDISLRYMRGDTADYLVQGAIDRSDGELSFNASRSRTDMFMVYVGYRW